MRRLREAGLSISPAIVLDAARALETCDLEPEPDLLHAVLRLTLARSRREQGVFDDVYRRYMASHRPPVPQARKKALPRAFGVGDGEPGGSGEGGERVQASAGPMGESRLPAGRPATPGRDSASNPQRPQTPDDGGRTRPSRGGPPPAGDEPARARHGTDPQGYDPALPRRGSDPRGREVEELLQWLETREGEASPEEDSNRPRADGRSPSSPWPGPHQGLDPSRPQGSAAGKPSVPDPRGGSGAPDLSHLERALTAPLDPKEEHLLLQAVRSMAEEVWIRRSRRSRRWKSGRVDVKATVALSRRTGGLPFRVARRRRRLRRARLVLLLDVSGSVRHAARFLLALAQAMQTAFSDARAFVFVNRPVEATRLLDRQDLPTMEAWMKASPEVDWMGMSDFGHAFFRMLEEHDRALRKDTLLVILGDARNNRIDPMTWALREIRERVGHIVWLNPEARQRWNTGDSVMRAYAGHCDAVEKCERLGDLRRVAERWAHLSARWR